MSRRLRRLPTALITLLLTAGALTACGNGDGGDSGDSGGDSPAAASALDAVTIEGAAGTAPQVTWKSEMTAGDVETEVLEAGDGEEVASGDQVSTHIWIGNGFTQEKSFSTYDEKKPELVTVDENLSPIFADALEGQTIGSRIAVTASAEKAFGEQGNPQLGIGNKDSVLVIVDLISKNVVLDGPEGTEKKAPAWAPKLEQDGDAVTAFDFSKAPKPSSKLLSSALIVGEGPAVKKGQTISVNYLGQVYGGKAPFDESYSKGAPASFPIGAGQVIPGWDKVLVGAKVGSRILMAIPPADGYGDAGNPDAGIKGTDTLYFVVDILAAG